MIYLGGRWPLEYRNQIFMNNIHGQRINMDRLEARGSGYVGSHGPDFLLTQDRASQVLNLRYGPDGQVTMIDWYDMQACHVGNIDRHDRINGRVYRITFGESPPTKVDLKSLSNSDLIELMLDSNDWYVRHARRILQERAHRDTLEATDRQRLREIAISHSESTRRLRAIWALHVTGGITDDMVRKLIVDTNAYVRGWII